MDDGEPDLCESAVEDMKEQINMLVAMKLKKEMAKQRLNSFRNATPLNSQKKAKKSKNDDEDMDTD